jgi:Sulfite exporter TauE/SafE
VVDVKTAVAVLVIPNLVMDALQLRRQGPIGDAPHRLATLLVFTILGTIIGTKLLVALPARTVTLILGIFVLGFVALDLMRLAPRVPPGWERRLAPPVGLVSGIMGGITNAPGTALALYFVALGMDKREFVRSIAFTFLVVKSVQLATLGWYGLFGWHLVLLEDPELLQLHQVHGAEGLARAHRAEGDRLEARAALLGPVGHEDEVEVRPLPARHVEDRALAALVLDRDELVCRRPVLHLDQELRVGRGIRLGGDAEVGGKVLAPEPERRGVVAEGLDLVPRPAEDGLHEGLGDTALDFEEIHNSP